MHLHIAMTLALIQEPMMALRPSAADSDKGWLALSIEDLWRDGAWEMESDESLTLALL